MFDFIFVIVDCCAFICDFRLSSYVSDLVSVFDVKCLVFDVRFSMSECLCSTPDFYF